MSFRKQDLERLRKQRERQQKVRERNKRDRKPSRDDIARVLLHIIIMRSYQKNQMHMLDSLFDVIVGGLKVQGFDKDASYSVIDDLIEKYTKSNWQFFRKLHLKEENAPIK